MIHVATFLHAAETDYVDTATLSERPSSAGTCMLEEYIFIDDILFIYIKISTFDLDAQAQARHCLPPRIARHTYLNQDLV